jgi:hypothetical protein
LRPVASDERGGPYMLAIVCDVTERNRAKQSREVRHATASPPLGGANI